MRASKRVLVGLAVAISGLGLFGSLSSAQPMTDDDLEGTSIPAVVDYNTRIDTYYQDDSIGGDANFLFNIRSEEGKIRRAGRQFEALYHDLMHQQDIDNPIMRTKDLPNPFSSSMYQMQSPATTSAFESSFQ